MKKLGMWAAVRAIPPVMGAVFNRAHGDRSYDMPPLRMIQDSGIMWGFHTDTTEVNQYKPFVTLWFAVTGKMVGGKVVNHQTITREEALIAHTRSNSFFVMRENDLGSIRAGQAGGSRRDGSGLPDDSGGSDQGHQAGDDDGRRQDGVRRRDAGARDPVVMHCCA